MIVIRAALSEGRLVLEVDGHANGAADGRVCAAVSAITQTALLGLAEVARQHPTTIDLDITEDT